MAPSKFTHQSSNPQYITLLTFGNEGIADVIRYPPILLDYMTAALCEMEDLEGRPVHVENTMGD